MTSARTTIKSLHITNYKALSDVEISLEPLTIFVGRNGTGKSTILDCIQFITDAIRENLDFAVLINRNGIDSLVNHSSKSKRFEISMSFEFSETSLPWAQIKDLQTVETPVKGNYMLRIGGDRRGEYRIIDERYDCKEKKDSMSHRKFKKLMSENDFGDALANTNLFMNNIFTKSSFGFSDFLRRSQKYTIYPDSLRLPQRSANSQYMLANGENLATILKSLKERKPEVFSEIINALRAINPNIQSVDVIGVGGYLTIAFRHDKASNKNFTYLSDESDGTIRSLAILTAIYYSSIPRLIAIEEPELGIHPGGAKVLAEVLMDASKKHQILITSHNPDLLEWLPGESIRMVGMRDGNTYTDRLNESIIELIRDEMTSPGHLLRSGALSLENDE